MTRRIIAFILLAGIVLVIQGVKINRPYEGHFASYQLTMATMARNMLKENFAQPLLPKTDILVNGQKSLHLNQYPFPSVIAAACIKVFGGSFELWGRLQAIICNLLSILLVGLIARKLWDEKHAWAAMVIYAFSPYTLIYGQGFFSEPMALLFLLLSLFFLIGSESWVSTLSSALFFSLAVTSRVHWVLLLPVLLFWIFFLQKEKRLTRFLGFSAIALALPAAWYGYTYWMGMRTDHLLTNIFLQLGMREVGDHKYLLDPDYYRRILDIFSGTMLTPLVFPFFILGIFLQNSRRGIFLTGGILIGSLIIILSPQKVMAHDFYLYGTFPFICWIAAAGTIKALESFSIFEKNGPKIFCIILYLLFSSRYFYHPIFKHDLNQPDLFKAAAAVKNHTHPEDTIIVASVEPAILVYYADRPAVTLDLTDIGGTLAPYLKNPKFTKVNLEDIQNLETAMKDPVAWLEYLRQKGALYLVTPEKKEIEKTPLLDYLEAHYQKISGVNDPFCLFRLTAKS